MVDEWNRARGRGMYIKGLRCVSCHKFFEINPIYECDDCLGILDVEYDYESIKEKQRGKIFAFDLLPVSQDEFISLGEGNTSLIKTGKLAQRLGLKNLYLKNEFSNPTGSFKDRPVSVAVSMAVKFGYKKVVVASSGNGAAAVSAYAARAGLEAVIMVPDSTPEEKVKQSLAYGSKVIKVEGPYSNSFQMAKEVGERFNMFNLTSTFINPYTLEGDKVVAYEMYEQLSNEVPDIIYVPIGAGPLLVGISKGYKELMKLGFTFKTPKLAGIQAEGCSPIAQAFISGEDSVNSETNPVTIAGGICDGLHGYEKDGTYTLKTIRESDGIGDYVTDNEISKAQEWLAKDEGIFVEPAAAASIAAIAKHIETGQIHSGMSVVAILTGHGLKDIKSVNWDTGTGTLTQYLGL